MGDELVHFEFSSHVVVNEIGELGSAFDSAKSASFPHTAGNELECYSLLALS